MGFDMSNPGLGLGLGLGLQDENCMKKKQNRQRQKKKEIEDPCNNKASYPSLTLGPPHDDQQQITKDESDEYNYYSPSAVSNSLSNCSSIKREREELELEVDKIPSRLVDVDEINENGNPKKKLRLTKQQSAVLEDSFKEHSTLSPKQKQELAKKLNLRARQVEVWFQNRRARTKLKQTEVDCELLKKCCESLTEENKRLQKELQELKSTPGHFYMQVPVATLTICPSCDTICGGNGGAINSASSPTTPLLISPNPNHQFYKNSSNYTFTQSPAAC